MEAFLSQEFIPLIAAVALFVFGLSVLTTGNLTFLRGRDAKPVRDPEHYGKWAAGLMFFLSGISLAMALIKFFIGEIPGIATLVAGLVVFLVLWVRMDKLYGE